MGIPALSDDGYLPKGIHDCSLDELFESFSGGSLSGRRAELCRKLIVFVEEIRSTNMAVGLIVDGSFVTQKTEPNDVDLILILRWDHDFTSVVRPFEYDVLSRRRVQRRYEFDLLVARDNSSELKEYIEFFQQIRGRNDCRKGLIRVQL